MVKMKRRGCEVSIVIPTWEEEKNLPLVLKEIRNFFRKNKHSYEILVIDRYSKDRTVSTAKKFGCRILFDNKGKGSAIRKGMKHAKGKIIVTMDADISHRPIELGLMIAGIKAGYDIVMGSRFIQGGGTGDMPWYRRVANKLFVKLINLVWSMNYSDLCYGYRAFNRKVLKKLRLQQDGFGIETEISVKAAKKGLKVLEVPSFEKKRLHGEGKLRSLRDGYIILKTIVNEILKGR